MEYVGNIHLDREPTFSQGQILQQMFEKQYEDKPYTRMGLILSADGRNIHWDGSRCELNIPAALVEVIRRLKEFRIRSIGVMKAVENGHTMFEIIVIKDLVKVRGQNGIRTITKIA